MVRRKQGFSRGDIVTLNLDPTFGKEQHGEHRPALILSPKIFNDLGMVLVAPITLSGSGSKTQGIVLLNQIRMVD